ncbi:hypothetical protein BpHYR1_034576 [Brachionus plicatilis]|uniref:Uncharacterized protein n=1 Tax=Brachionus plicatilis TaxID=10195 RepID=A0A3M7R870_BRAPC|nr:hypothetical protein BpHYR1_034576 [Brachionus plicatilis]
MCLDGKNGHRINQYRINQICMNIKNIYQFYFEKPNRPYEIDPFRSFLLKSFEISKRQKKIQYLRKSNLQFKIMYTYSQGQTIDKAVIDLGKKEQSLGFTFVALSRIIFNLKIKLIICFYVNNVIVY